jgi:hypothetical protein
MSRGRTSTALAWTLCAVAVVLGVLAIVLAAANRAAADESLIETFPLGAVLAISFPVVGAVIASRRPGNWMGWIFCVIGVSQGLVEFSYEYAQYALKTEPGSLPAGDLAAWMTTWAWVPGYGLLITFLLLLFPTGRLPSRRWRPVAWLSGLAIAAMLASALGFWRYRGERLLRDTAPIEDALGLPGTMFGLGFPLLLICGVASTVALILRFRRARGDERLQLKWFTYAALAVTTFAILGEGILGEWADWEAFRSLLAIALIPCVPIATGIAILKYRLYDIDRIINKTIVFGLVTAVLIAGYAGGILLLQSLLPVPDDSQVIVAVSTLAMAALFAPLRRRIQEVVDRRFYRARYDATQAVEGFGSRLRAETDLNSLASDLIGVVTRTVQPAHASLWLRSSTSASGSEPTL